MGVLQRFEQRLEGLVGGTFARLFKGQVEPVEVAKALQREAEDKKAILGANRVLVPNRYTVELGPTDHDRLSPWAGQLTRTLAEMVQEYVDDEGWSAYGDIEVAFARNDALRTGVFHVSSDVDVDVAPRRRPHDSLSMPAVPSEPQSQPYPSAPRSAPAPTPTQAVPPVPAQTPAAATAAPRRPTPAPVLIIDDSGRRFPVQPGSTLIGRGQDADIRLADTGVSRRHAVVRYDGQAVLIEDLGSTNGTLVNGQRVRTSRLQQGDVIRAGHSVIVFRIEPS